MGGFPSSESPNVYGGPHFQVRGAVSKGVQLICPESTIVKVGANLQLSNPGVIHDFQHRWCFCWVFFGCWQSWHPTVGVPNLGKIECNWSFFSNVANLILLQYILYIIYLFCYRFCSSGCCWPLLLSFSPTKKNKTNRLFRGDDNFDKQELLDHNIEVFKEVGFPCRVNRLVGGLL